MTAPPDVTIVSPYPTPGREIESGVAAYARCLSQALAAAGAGVTVVAPGSGVDYDGPVRVERCFSRGPLGVSKAVTAALDTNAPMVHVQHEAFLYGGPDAVPGLLLALARLRKARRGPVVTMHQVVEPATVDRAFTEMHRVRVPAPLARAGLAALQSSISRIAGRVVVHEHAFNRVLPRSVVMPLGAGETQSLPPASGAGHRPEVQALRTRCGADDRSFLVLCFGFVAPYKGVETALEAARFAGPDVRLAVAGGEHPRLSGHGYLDGLKDGYSDVATFAGYVPEADVAGWFAAADAVLLAYPQPFSSSGVLALAIEHGTPALLSPALAEVVGFPAELSVPLDGPGLAARLRQLAQDRVLLGELTERTRQLRDGRSWPQVAERHLSLYEEVIHAQSPARRPLG